MEAVRDFVSFQDSAGATATAGQLGVDKALMLLQGLGPTVVEDAAAWGLQAASEFAGRVEELSRTVEYLQLVAAGAVDRARRLPPATAFTGSTSWTTGWRDSANDLTARDQGCAFPGCTIPAPWCEAHHISYWSRGGSTGTDNGTLLCSHHHHLVHKEHWSIQSREGIPWFIPPPHLDPRQVPRRNHYFRLE